MAEILLSPLFLPEESSKEFFFFWGGGGNCFISNVLTKKTQIMFVSIHEKWHLAQQKLHLSSIKPGHSEITHVQARITHVQPTTGSSTCEDGKKTCTQFLVKTSFDLIMPTSRSNENRQRGYQLNSSFSKFYILRMFYVCFSPAFSGSRPWVPGSWQLWSVITVEVICILSNKTFARALYPSDWRFLLRCPAAFWDKICWQIRKRGFTTSWINISELR